MMRFICGFTLAAACWGQFFEANKETTVWSDGCNTTTCIKGQYHCSSTLAMCFKGEGIEFKSQAGKELVRVSESGAVKLTPASGDKTLTLKNFFKNEAYVPGDICGSLKEFITPNIDLIAVSCVDYEALRAVMPDVPWPAGQRTQVVIHLRRGEAVRVVVDGVVKFADAIDDTAYNRRIAKVDFDGTGHKEVSVKVLAEVQ